MHARFAIGRRPRDFRDAKMLLLTRWVFARPKAATAESITLLSFLSLEQESRNGRAVPQNTTVTIN